MPNFKLFSVDGKTYRKQTQRCWVQDQDNMQWGQNWAWLQGKGKTQEKTNSTQGQD